MEFESFKISVLWTDYLIYFMVAAIALFIFTLRKNPQNASKWRMVFSTGLGMATFVIILSYVSVALLDSLHFRKALPVAEGQQAGKVYYSNDVNSVMDLLLGEMGERDERTYSAPFALKSWNRENIKQEDGSTVRDYPELKYSGLHLQEGDDVAGDIVVQSFKAIAKGLAFALVLILAHWFWLKRRGTENDLPWGSAWLTFAIIIAFMSWLISLGNLYHVLGTDQAGNDTLYETLKGIRTAVLIGSLATIITLPFAIVFGISAGYFKGWVDDVVQYVYTTLSSIPSILLIAALVLLFQVWMDNNPGIFEVALEKADGKFLALCFILGITSWAGLCRLLRAETLKISQLEYVQAAHAFGVSHVQVIWKHILPNLSHIIMIAFVLDFSAMVLAEAVLSYIGIGVDPAMASWGNMINLASTELGREPSIWWNLSGAFFLMFTLVLAVNLFSDLVNDAFNPKTQLETA